MYGDNAREIRDGLASLLRQHRITQRLGGPGIWSVPASTTIEQRRAMGEQVQRYRRAVLVWCRGALNAANPQPELATRDSSQLVGRLRERLDRAIEASETGLPRWANSPLRKSSNSSTSGAEQPGERPSASTTSAPEPVTAGSRTMRAGR